LQPIELIYIYIYIIVGNVEGTRPLGGTLGMDGQIAIWKWIFKKCDVREKAHFW
jgi:hypothetical protein